MSPTSKFHSDKAKGEITFEQYYQEAYGLKLINKKQPLIKAISKIEKKMQKNGKLEEIEHIVYLIP